MKCHYNHGIDCPKVDPRIPQQDVDCLECNIFFNRQIKIDKTWFWFKVVILSLFVLAFTSIFVEKCSAQRRLYKPVKYNHAISFTYQKEDNGVGLRYDHISNNLNGAYGSLSWGNYVLDNGSSIKNHVKLGIGAVMYFHNADNLDFVNIFSLGISGHYYGKKEIQYIDIPAKVYLPISAEFGVGCHIKRIMFGFRFDPFKWEGGLDAGFIF